MNTPAEPTPESEPLGCGVSGEFPEWLAGQDGSLAVTTYQAGKVVLVGFDGGVTALFRHFARPMGMAVDGSRMALALKDQLWLLTDTPTLAASYSESTPSGGPDPAAGRYDAFYLPRVSYFTGAIDAHDLAFGNDGLWVVNTQFSCLAQCSDTVNFTPRWRPKFISALAPEDRCHLNGLALVDGSPKYVTALAATDSVQGWRPVKAHGGVVVDVTTDAIVLHTLSMPHSPRWHGGRLWFLNSGAGELCVADPGKPGYTVVAILPGFLRGLCFVGNHAIVGLSKLRPSGVLTGLPIQNRFPQLLCGVAVVDLSDGHNVGTLEFTGGCSELYEVQWLPNRRRPMILNMERQEQTAAFVTPEQGWLIEKPKPEETKPPPGAWGGVAG
jgi:uncharacterized protein (TIGR03032 family)